MAMSTESKMNTNAATAILLRLNAFQVRCDGVNSAKSIEADLWLNIVYFGVMTMAAPKFTVG